MSEHFGNDALRQETNAGKADMHILHSLPAALIRRGNIGPVHKIMQYRRPQNYFLVREALQKAGRTDLIGFTPKCLIRPYPPKEKKAGAPDQPPERKSAPAKPAKKRPPRR